MGVMVAFNILFASTIAFGVVYNAARISLSERSRELASLRVLGFTRAEISSILLGELALLTLRRHAPRPGDGHRASPTVIMTFDADRAVSLPGRHRIAGPTRWQRSSRWARPRSRA